MPPATTATKSTTPSAKAAAIRKTDRNTDACPKTRPAPDGRALAAHHRAIGIAAVAAAVRYQGSR